MRHYLAIVRRGETPGPESRIDVTGKPLEYVESLRAAMAEYLTDATEIVEGECEW